jgi:hypothetical protein
VEPAVDTCRHAHPCPSPADVVAGCASRLGMGRTFKSLGSRGRASERRAADPYVGADL